MGGLRAADVQLNRKMLAQLAQSEPFSFRAVFEVARDGAELRRNRTREQHVLALVAAANARADPQVVASAIAAQGRQDAAAEEDLARAAEEGRKLVLARPPRRVRASRPKYGLKLKEYRAAEVGSA